MIGTADRRPATRVGTHARLELIFANRDGRTVLTHGYAEPPFRVGRCFAEGHGLHMILASSAPGVFGGDQFVQHVRVEEGARVRLTSQSALQIHPAVDGSSAGLNTTYEVAAGASLVCEWDPMIPFNGAGYRQSIDLRVAEGGTLYWMDAFASGRSASGERWRFRVLEQELRLVRGDSLDYLERYRLAPGETELAGPWVAAEATCFGTGLVSGPAIESAKVERLQEELAADKESRAACDFLDRNLLIIRMMSKSHVRFHAMRQQVRACLLPE